MGNQKGFTLIELIMVIVILGVLAAAAVPKYQDLRTEAVVAAANGVYGGAQGATAINFAARLFSASGSTAITDAATLVGAMEELPVGWTINGATLEYIDDTTYNIIVATAESPGGASVPTQKAILQKSW